MSLTLAQMASRVLRNVQIPEDTSTAGVQALADAYGLRKLKPAQLEQFGRAHFGSAAGLAQQYLFSAARHGKLITLPPEPTRPKSRR